MPNHNPQSDNQVNKPQNDPNRSKPGGQPSDQGDKTQRDEDIKRDGR